MFIIQFWIQASRFLGRVNTHIFHRYTMTRLANVKGSDCPVPSIGACCSHLRPTRISQVLQKRDAWAPAKQHSFFDESSCGRSRWREVQHTAPIPHEHMRRAEVAQSFTARIRPTES